MVAVTRQDNIPLTQVLKQHHSKTPSTTTHKVPRTWDEETQSINTHLVQLDAGNLTVFDAMPLSDTASCTTRFFKDAAREATQMLMNTIFSLPRKTTADGILAELPEPTTVIPREKPASVYVMIPKEKPMTKWEKFAKAKGIQKTKKSRMVFDEATQEYAPRFGYQSKQNDPMTNWLIELPSNADPNEDPREKLKQDKKERINKNKQQQQKNIERNQGNNSTLQQKKKSLENQIKTTKLSTASLGKFDKEISQEPKLKRTTKRKFDSNTGDFQQEKAKVAKIVSKVAEKSGQGVLNTSKAMKKVDQRSVVQKEKRKQSTRRRK